MRKYLAGIMGFVATAFLAVFCGSISVFASSEFLYLSDLSYSETVGDSYVGWNQTTIKEDVNINDGGQITLYRDGAKVGFSKGIEAHATSQVIYDISEYSGEYSRFYAFLGVDGAMQVGRGSVRFIISTSLDKQNWTTIYTSEVLKAGDEAIEVDLDIRDAKWLKLYADKVDTNASDHATYADARLLKTDYDLGSEISSEILTLAEYDAVLRASSAEENITTNLHTLLKRELVRRYGYWNLQRLLAPGAESREAVLWLINSEENLSLFFEGGESKNPGLALENVAKLYNINKDILGESGDGYVYKKMLIALALAHSSDYVLSPMVWPTSGVGSYDIVEKYRLIKYLYDNNRFEDKEEFKTYKMEIMRMVMNNGTPNDELMWLSYYSQYHADTFGNGTMAERYNVWRFTPAYIQPTYGAEERYFSEENRAFYTDKYKLESSLLSAYSAPAFSIAYGAGNSTKYWMYVDLGGICWNTSRMGQSLLKTWGIPSVGAFQPGHEAFMRYTEENGIGKWTINNNVGQWGRTYTTWGGDATARYLFNWASSPYTNQSFNSAGYLLLGQAALNDYGDTKKSMYYNMLASVYEGDEAVSIYNTALSAQELNFDSYLKLIQNYEAAGKSAAEWNALAERIIASYTYYPNVMYDLTTHIRQYIEADDLVVYDLKVRNALELALEAEATNVLQYNEARNIAAVILNQKAGETATFSFDGENAGKVVFSEDYQNSSFQVEYTVDGGANWTSVANQTVISLSPAELAAITAENDIIVKFTAADIQFTIDITKGEAVSSANFALHDEENKFFASSEAVFDNLVYSVDAGATWAELLASTKFEGEKNVLVKRKAAGTQLESDTVSFNFTSADTADPNSRYVPVSEIQLVHYGTAQPGQEAVNFIDANPFTIWHTKWGEVVADKTFVVSFDKVKHVNKLKYEASLGNGNGRIGALSVYTSLDNQNWTLVKTMAKDEWANNTADKILELGGAFPAKYVKLEMTQTYGPEGANKYISGKNISFYEDSTLEYKPEAMIDYDVNSLTNKDVTATVVLGDGCELVEGEVVSYVFTANGTYTFNYLDAEGNPQSIVATVDWIDKTPPTATVQYDVITPTNFAVVAFIRDTDLEAGVTITNVVPTEVREEDGTFKYLEWKHTFIENGSFTFELVDEAGNVGTAIATVDWIGAAVPEPEPPVVEPEKPEENEPGESEGTQGDGGASSGGALGGVSGTVISGTWGGAESYGPEEGAEGDDSDKGGDTGVEGEVDEGSGDNVQSFEREENIKQWDVQTTLLALLAGGVALMVAILLIRKWDAERRRK